MASINAPTYFDALSRLSGRPTDISRDLEALDRNLRVTLPHMHGLSPLRGRDVGHRSAAWLVGKTGFVIGHNDTPLQMKTSGSNGLIFYVPLTGYLRIRQDERKIDTREPSAWLLMAAQPTASELGESCSVAISLDAQRLCSTANTILGFAKGTDSRLGEKTEVIDLSSPKGARAKVQFPFLLYNLGKIALDSPSGEVYAEDMIYRFVSCLILDESKVSASRLRESRVKLLLDFACGFMRAHMDQPITLTQIEAAVGLGRRALQNLFLARLALSPMQWLKQERLQLAHSMLRSGQHPSVATTALACGFSHFGRFSHDFHVRFGTLPLQVHRSRK